MSYESGSGAGVRADESDEQQTAPSCSTASLAHYFGEQTKSQIYYFVASTSQNPWLKLEGCLLTLDEITCFKYRMANDGFLTHPITANQASNELLHLQQQRIEHQKSALILNLTRFRREICGQRRITNQFA